MALRDVINDPDFKIADPEVQARILKRVGASPDFINAYIESGVQKRGFAEQAFDKVAEQAKALPGAALQLGRESLESGPMAALGRMALVPHAEQAKKAMNLGDVPELERAAESLAAFVPGGPQGASIGESIRNRDYGGAAVEGAELAASLALPFLFKGGPAAAEVAEAGARPPTRPPGGGSGGGGTGLSVTDLPSLMTKMGRARLAIKAIQSLWKKGAPVELPPAAPAGRAPLPPAPEGTIDFGSTPPTASPATGSGVPGRAAIPSVVPEYGTPVEAGSTAAEAGEMPTLEEIVKGGKFAGRKVDAVTANNILRNLAAKKEIEALKAPKRPQLKLAEKPAPPDEAPPAPPAPAEAAPIREHPEIRKAGKRGEDAVSAIQGGDEATAYELARAAGRHALKAPPRAENIPDAGAVAPKLEESAAVPAAADAVAELQAKIRQTLEAQKPTAPPTAGPIEVASPPKPEFKPRHRAGVSTMQLPEVASNPKATLISQLTSGQTELGKVDFPTAVRIADRMLVASQTGGEAQAANVIKQIIEEQRTRPNISQLLSKQLRSKKAKATVKDMQGDGGTVID